MTIFDDLRFFVFRGSFYMTFQCMEGEAESMLENGWILFSFYATFKCMICGKLGGEGIWFDLRKFPMHDMQDIGY